MTDKEPNVATAQVSVTSQGVRFGNAWYSHERITGYTAQQLNEGRGVTGRAYMDWVNSAFNSASRASDAVMLNGLTADETDATASVAGLSAPAAVEQAASEREKFDDVLVPFLSLMRKELHANTGKGDRPGWLQMDANTALLEVYWHVAKLSAAVKNNDGPAIMEHGADVANMAMMVLDVCGGLALVDLAAQAAPIAQVEAAPAEVQGDAESVHLGAAVPSGGALP